tara:strand:+ start:5407 stop:6339 length:933 start_codon:yes stop_codon:yes gene_type:complete
MYLSSTPLRISLFGGSTDNPEFIRNYNKSLVISFQVNLRTYIFLHRDKYGINSSNNKYKIIYSRVETTDKLKLIKNKLIRHVLEAYDMPPVTVFVTSDIYSKGNGLSSSSSYILSLIKSCNSFHKIKLNDQEICKKALKIERKFNSGCGFQDPFGCQIPGLKIMKSTDDKNYKIKKINSNFLNDYSMYLLPTNIFRNSSKILKNLSKRHSSILPLYDTAIKAENLLINKKYNEFINLINLSWEQKKNTSSMIIKNSFIKKLDQKLKLEKNVLAYKLIGAGGGGFYFIISKKPIKKNKNIYSKLIEIRSIS